MGVFETAERIRDCLCAALTNPDRVFPWNPNATQCCVRPGATNVWDACGCDGDGGQLAVLFTSGRPTVSFPEAATGADSCMVTSQAVRFTVEALRCVCDSCDCEQLEAGAAAIGDDLEAVLAGLRCCFASNPVDMCSTAFVIVGWETVGPQGGCAGVRVMVDVNEPFPCC